MNIVTAVILILMACCIISLNNKVNELEESVAFNRKVISVYCKKLDEYIITNAPTKPYN